VRATAALRFGLLTATMVATSLPVGAAEGFPPGDYAIVVDGSRAGAVKSARRISKNFRFEVGVDVPRELGDWISESSQSGSTSKRDGEMFRCDARDPCDAALEFLDAGIVEVQVGTLDATSKEPGVLTVEIQPGEAHYPSGESETIPRPSSAKRSKWLSSNFRFELGDLPCERVLKVDSLGWRRVPEGEHSEVEVSDLELTISMADSGPWLAWYQSVVFDGEVNRLYGRFELLAANLSDTLASLDLTEVEIVSMTVLPMDGETGNFEVVLSIGGIALEFESSDP